jgi:hypothetical protein
MSNLFDAIKLGFQSKPQQTRASHSKSVIFSHFPKVGEFATWGKGFANLL